MGSYDLREYNAAIQSVIGSAAEAKVPFEQLNLVLGLASHAGLNLNRVTVGMNRIFDAMTNPTKANAKAFKGLNVDIDGMRASGKSLIDILVDLEDKVPSNKMREMFGTVQGVRAFRAIKSQMGDMGEGTRRMSEMVKNWGKGFDEAMGLAANRMIKTRNAWENFKMSLSGKLLDDSFLAGMDILDEIISGLVNTVGKMDFSPITKAFSAGMKDVWNTIKQIPRFLGEVLGISINWESVIKSVASYIIQVANFLSNPKTWEGLVQGTMKAAAYLEFAYSYIKKMISDTQLFNDTFSTLGSVIKSIGVFLIEVFKSAFEVTASYAEATLLPVLKEVGIQFGSFLMSGIGDALSMMGKAIMSLKIEIPAALKVLNPMLALMERSLNDYTDMAGGVFVSMGNAANTKSRTMTATTYEPVGEAGIYKTLRPILENGNKELIDRLISVALKTNVPGMEEGKNRPLVSSDELVAIINSIKGSTTLEEAQKKAYETGGIYSADTPLLLNKIYLALIDRSKADFVRQGTTDENLQGLIANIFSATRVENERNVGMNKFSNTNFSSDVSKAWTKLQNSLSTIMTTIGPTLKRENPEAFDTLAKRLEEINKIQFQVAEANTKATQENTAALNNAQKKKETTGEVHKHIRKLVAESQVESYMSKMKSRYKDAKVSSYGSVMTGRGPMAMVDTELSTNPNTVVKKSVEEQKKQEREDSGTGTKAVVDGVKGVATLTEQVLDELKQINKKTLAQNRFFNNQPMQPPKDNSFWNQMASFDIWEQN
jgi:hypothetical protein